MLMLKNGEVDWNSLHTYLPSSDLNTWASCGSEQYHLTESTSENPVCLATSNQNEYDVDILSLLMCCLALACNSPMGSRERYPFEPLP